MIASYTDESGHSQDPNCRFVGLAGFVSDSDNWTKFEIKWKAALDEFNGGREFHANEFYRRDPKSPYADWTEQMKSDFICRLMDAIDSADATAVGCVVSLDDFNALNCGLKNATVDPYYIAFQEVTKGLAFSGCPIDDDLKVDPVSMVYAYQKEFGATEGGRACQLWNIIKSSPKQFVWADWMGTYTSARPEQVLQLQAADLFAYTLTREFELWRLTEDIPPMRESLKRIINRHQKRLFIKLYEKRTLLDMLWNSGAFPDSTDSESPISSKAGEMIFMVQQCLAWRARQ